MTRFLIRAICVIWPLMFLLAGTASATLINVPADQPTIQAGIDAAASGDTILVAAGTYTGDGNRDIDFHGKNVVLRSSGGAAVTTIDCEGTVADPHRALFIHGGEDSTAVIDGFTISGTYGSVGAIVCASAGVRVSNCVVTQNSTAGLYCSNPSGMWLIIDNCQVSNNSTGALLGGDFVVRNSSFIANGANGVWVGGTGSQSEISYCLFSRNGLAGLLAQDMDGDLAYTHHCTFYGNRDGLACQIDMPAAKDTPAAVRLIENCVMAFNSRYGYTSNGYLNPIAKCSDAFGNGSGNWPSGASAPAPGDTLGNISYDPQFCDTALGKYTLHAASPCTPDHNRCGAAIGAFGAGCSCCFGVRGNINCDPENKVNLVDLSAMINCLTFYPNPLCTWNCCTAEANVDGDASGKVNLVDLSSLINFLTGGSFRPPTCPAGL